MRKSLEALAPYRPPRVRGLALHDNTNRLGANPAVARWGEITKNLALNAYPDSEAVELRAALAERHGLRPEHFLVANGSSEALELIFKTFLEPGEVVAFPGPSFAMYSKYAQINAVRPVEVPLDARFDLDAAALLAAGAALYVLCTPNNPTGNALSAERIEAVLRAGRPVVIDEAYGEFAQGTWMKRIEEFPNLLVTRTFSKAYGLAGLRVGYVAAAPEIITRLDKARLPYNLNALSQALAVAALAEEDFLARTLELVRRERPRWTQALRARGFRVWPSQANFLFAEVPPDLGRDALVQDLADRGVLIRACGTAARLARAVRITVGTPEDLEALLSALEAVL